MDVGNFLKHKIGNIFLTEEKKIQMRLNLFLVIHLSAGNMILIITSLR